MTAQRPARMWRNSVACLLTAASLAACSSGGGGAAIGGSTTTPNVSGTVSSTSGSSSFGYGKPGAALAAKDVGSLQAGCTVRAYAIEGGTQVGAATTTDSSGNYTITGVTAGTAYRVVADCSGSKFASVATAANSNPATITADQRVATNPRTTLIATMIMKAVLEALTEAVSGLPASVQTAVKQAVLGAIDSIITQVSVTITEAIDSGAMEEPSASTATSLATTVETTTDAATIDTAITNNSVDVPTSVSNAVTGAKAASSALAACDTNKGGTQDRCTQAVARLFYGLGFPVAFKKSGGAFGAITCASSQAIGSTTLGAMFPDATFADGDGTQIKTTYCTVKSTLGRPDRNRDFNNGGGGGGDSFMTESGDYTGDATEEAGLLSAVATASFNGYEYLLSDLDKFVVGYDATTGAGDNGRLINTRRNWSSGGFPTKSYYIYDGTSWSNSLWPSKCNADGYSGYPNGSNICNINAIDWQFSNSALWSSSTNETALGTAMQNGNMLPFKIFEKMFGGTIPTQAELESYLNEDKTHREFNPTGQPEFHVVTTKQPSHDPSVGEVCWDNDPSTPCVGDDGNPIVPIRVNLVFGTKDATGFRPISQVNKSDTGAYYMRPYYDRGQFSGVFAFIKVSDGKIVLDELMRERGMKVVLTQASECNTNGLPTTGNGCADGNKYNVSISWDGCNQNQACPGYTENAADATIAGDYTPSVQSNYNMAGEMYCNGSNTCQHWGVVASGNWPNVSPLKFSVSVDVSGSDTFTYTSTGRASAAGEYNLVQDYDCSSGTACTSTGKFFFVNHEGAIHSDAQADGSADGRYLKATVDAITVGSGTVGSVSSFKWVYTGPVRSRSYRCEAEPYFIDLNGNGQLDCTTQTVNGITYSIVNGDKTFGGQWDYQNWINAPSVDEATRTARAAYNVQEHKNAYVLGDPVGAMKLLGLAFAGYFDGTHSFTSTTRFNALQALALLYMFFEEEGGDRWIEGIGVTDSPTFKFESPRWLGNDSGGDAGLSAAFLNYHQ